MASWDIVLNSGDFYLVLGRFKWGKIKDIIPGGLGFLKETEMTSELEPRTVHANEEIKRPENQINIRSLEVTNDFAVNEKVMGFWKPEKKWYSATVLEKTKPGYKVVFADDNLVRVLSLQNLRKKTSR